MFLEKPFKGIAGPTLPPHLSSSQPSTHDSSFIHKNPNKNVYDSSVSNENEDENGKENGIHPLYSTNNERPHKGVVSQKPMKKPTKSDSKYQGPFASLPSPPPQSTENTKYDFDNYDDGDEEQSNKKLPPPTQNGNGPGPGFFNPSITKHQYSDYDQTLFNNGDFHQPQQQKPHKQPYNPYIIQHGDGQQELINILGGNAQNIPPHLRIEHILQHIQGTGAADNDGQTQSTYGGQQTPNYPFNPQGQPIHMPNEAHANMQGRPNGMKVSQPKRLNYEIPDTNVHYFFNGFMLIKL